MQTIYKLPETLQADLDRLCAETERYKSGELSAAQYRAFRVPQGVYEQRRDGAFMLRVRLPGGAMLPHQMRTLAAIARQHGSGELHLTTRQDIQVHDVPLDGIHPALAELYARAGLSAKGGGGNTVRNITACPFAGVCKDEVFDVSPHTVALTEYMLPDPVSFQLPRKYKIAFSGCSKDCIGGAVNDLGFVATEGDNGPGFAVYVGGGMGARSRVGELLEAFVPENEIHLVAEAVKRVFDKHGNRKNRNRARIRFLIEDKGLDAFKDLYAAEHARLREEGGPALDTRELPVHSNGAAEETVASADGFDEWRDRNVESQKQSGLNLVHVPLFLGDIAANVLEELADVADARGEGVVRVTPSQNLVIRSVPAIALPALHQELLPLGLADAQMPVLRETIACTGAATCKLGICLSQGMAKAVRDELVKSDLELEEAVDLRLHINGCPNSCGRHPIASIGLVGAARRIDNRLVPHYVIQLGGRVGVDKTRLATGREAVPVRNGPAFIVELLRAFRESEDYPDFDTFLDSGGREAATRIAVKHKQIPPFVEDRNYYYDWGAEEPFSLAGRGPGECSAGVFDLIRIDLASAREAHTDGRLATATGLAARAMLITQGEEAKDAADALRLFEKRFLDTGLVGGSFRGLIASAGKHVRAGGAEEGHELAPAAVTALIDAVEKLYEDMDQSLRFHTPAAATTEPEVAAEIDVEIDREADFHGVTCPLNYVKTKLLLGQMKTGEVLSILLDDAGAQNVPESAEKDGHEVLYKQKQGDRWRVIVRKR